MSVAEELADLAEVVRDQVAQGIARDLAIKVLVGLVAQMVGEDQFKELAVGHLKAIQRLEAGDEAETEMNDKVADHFHDLLIESAESGLN
ncbi:hypothetical protein P7D22_08590 [Lichenihabitans sp. Uapishka_5]|uniref:hypothetical protein n=1 Tax=Lichenihabitans sp. Uapishka_5 TaxID=3037302 RepID=UPI0029E7E292|nr:hypothetical protein [Lichenihabitans sp. Uapishka_5]MDX7951233.1 hypothetical protein [Lichenihabitans sp. Uapishka_5]